MKRKRTRRVFSEAQKIEVVRQLLSGEHTTKDIAQSIGVRPEQIYKWKHSYAIPPLDPGQGRDFEADEEMQKLRKKANMEHGLTVPDFRINFCPNCSADQRRLKDVDDDVHWCYRCGCCLHKIDLY